METDSPAETVQLVAAQVKTTSDRPAAGNPFEEAFAALEKMADAEGIPIAIIGAAAATHHGCPRATTSIDVAVGARDFARLLRECQQYGFRFERTDPTGAFELTYEGALVKVWQQGLFADDLDAPEALPHPAELGVTQGLGFATLPAWVRLKLVRDNPQDQADIVEVIKPKSQADIQEIEQYLTTLPPVFLDNLRRLQATAEGKKAQQAGAHAKGQRS